MSRAISTILEFASEHDCKLAQGASVVRFANSALDAHKKKDFVFVAISIKDIGWPSRYRHFLFQKKGSRIWKVCERFTCHRIPMLKCLWFT
jgi:hypothetical protein